MTTYERRVKQAASIAEAAHDFDARQEDIFREDVLGASLSGRAAIPTEPSLHLLVREADAAGEDEDAEPPRCPVCGGPVEEMLRNYQAFTVCTESLAPEGANCAWFRPGKIADALRAAREEAERGNGEYEADGDGFDYGQVPPPRAPATTKTSKSKPGPR